MMRICIALFFSLSLLEAQAADKAAIAFKHASQLQKSSRYEEALLEFQEIEREYPYSRFAKKSKLKVADIHFSMTNYAQAQYQYQYYYDLFPAEDTSDYALYRAGYSQFKQLPKTIDRDLSLTSSVLKTWRSVLVRFPKSQYTNEILKHQKELIKKLGKKELYIAQFYLKRKKYISAQRRFNKLFTQFPSFKTNKKAVRAALECAKALEDTPKVNEYKNLLKKKARS